MLMYKLNTFEEFQKIKAKLLKLNSHNEERIFTLFKSPGDEHVQFKEGNASNLVYDHTVGLGSKMVWRFRNMPDVVYFWNSIDPNNREILLRSVGLTSMGLGMDFFVWLANTHMHYKEDQKETTAIGLYFAAEEVQKKTWIAEYAEVMKDFHTY
jgi:hypothetical protein